MNTFEYRIGNPVKFEGAVVHIKQIPSDGVISGYSVTGSSFIHKKEELIPIPIDTDVLSAYKAYYEKKSGYYVFDGRDKTGMKHKIVFHPDDNSFSVNGQEGGKADYLHTLSNTIEDLCGYPLHRYYGPVSFTQSSSKRTTEEDIRKNAYSVLYCNYPHKMTSGEIKKDINKHTGASLTYPHVYKALRKFALHNKHFAIFPSFFPSRIRFSIYLLDTPYTDNKGGF